jgi:hypothetical protein
MDDAARAAEEVRRLPAFAEAARYGEVFRYPAERDRISFEPAQGGLLIYRHRVRRAPPGGAVAERILLLAARNA